MESLRGEQSPNQERERYLVPAELVHKLLVAAQLGYSSNNERDARRKLHEIFITLSRLVESNTRKSP